MAKPIPGALGPPSISRQAVVTATAEQRVLRAQTAMREFKRRARVVVQPAHQPMIPHGRERRDASSAAHTAAKCAVDASSSESAIRGSVSMIG